MQYLSCKVKRNKAVLFLIITEGKKEQAYLKMVLKEL